MKKTIGSGTRRPESDRSPDIRGVGWEKGNIEPRGARIYQGNLGSLGKLSK